jgi:phage shock protein A
MSPLFDRINRVVRSNLNDMVSKAEDPEKLLELTIIDIQEDLVQLRQAVAQAIASQKRSHQQYNQYQSQGNQWLSRAQVALQKGDENLAREALQRKKSYEDQANTIKATLDQQTAQVDTLKRNLIQLENKISEAKTKKNMLKARAQAAKANEQLQGMIGGINTTGGMAAFERMEQKVLEMQARSQSEFEPIRYFEPKIEEQPDSHKLLEKAIQETRLAMNHAVKSKEYLQKQLSEQDSIILQLKQHLITLESLKTQLNKNVSEKANNTSLQKGTSLEEWFTQPEDQSNFYDDLEALKTQMLGSAKTQGQLAESQKTEVDNELEELRQQLDNL